MACLPGQPASPLHSSCGWSSPQKQPALIAWTTLLWAKGGARLPHLGARREGDEARLSGSPPAFPVALETRFLPLGCHKAAQGALGRRGSQNTSPSAPCSPACRWHSRPPIRKSRSQVAGALQPLSRPRRQEARSADRSPLRSGIGPDPWPRPPRRAQRAAIGGGAGAGLRGGPRGPGREGTKPGRGKAAPPAGWSVPGRLGGCVRRRSSWDPAGIASVCAGELGRERLWRRPRPGASPASLACR